MDASGQNYKDIFRYTDVEYTPEGHTDVYRWDDFLGIAGGHVLSAKCIVDSVSPGGEFEGDEPEYAYACEIVGCCGLSDGVALLRPVSHGGNDLIQIGNEPDFQEWLCSMYLRDQVEDRLRHEISCNCMQSTVDAFKLLSDKIGFEFEPENNPANVAKAASAAAGRSVDSGLSEAGGIKH